MAVQVDLKRALNAIDKKQYDFYDRLTPEEQKALSPFILMKFASNVKGDRDTTEWFIEMTNELVNKNHWDLSKSHKALLWKLLAATGVGVNCYHSYLKFESKESKAPKIAKLLEELHPSYKAEDIRLLANLMTKAEINELLDGMGFDKAQRKEFQ